MFLRPYKYVDKKDYPTVLIEPLGIEYLASSILDGNEIMIMDCQNEGWYIYEDYGNKDMVRQGLNLPAIIKRIEEFKPDAIAISILTYYEEEIFLEIIPKIRNRFLHIKIIAGGVYVNTERENVFNKISDVDILAVGEGEHTFKELIENKFRNLNKIDGIIYKEKGEIKINPPRKIIGDLDELPYPYREHLIPKETARVIKYHILRHEFGWFDKVPHLPNFIDDIFGIVFNIATHTYVMIRNLFSKEQKLLMKYPEGFILSSRGCPNNCSFCATHNTFGKRFRMRSAENVLGEIDILVKKYKVKRINFVDDNVTVSKKRMMDICNGITQRGYKIQLHNANGTFLPNLDEELLVTMKKAGYVSLAFGVETGNQHTMDYVIDKRQDLNKVREIIQLCRKLNIKTTGFFVIGLVGETLQSIRDTIKFAKETGFDRVQTYIAQPIKGSRMYNEAVEKGYLSKDYDPRMAKFQRNRCFLNTPEFNSGDVEKIFNKMMEDTFFKFY